VWCGKMAELYLGCQRSNVGREGGFVLQVELVHNVGMTCCSGGVRHNRLLVVDGLSRVFLIALLG
jgi:hypothetical protein